VELIRTADTHHRAPRAHRTTHTIDIAAGAQEIYDWIADVTLWPVIFAPTIDVHHLERTHDRERFQIWATVNDEVSSWTSKRTLDNSRFRIDFQQEQSSPPIHSMEGQWRFIPTEDSTTRVELDHHFEVSTAEDADWITRALDINSAAELAALRRVSELGYTAEQLSLTFEDTLSCSGAAEHAYRFIYEAGRWAQRLPHVSEVTLTESTDRTQDLRMTTVTADGSTHVTHSTRLCNPPTRISYKQHLVPELLVGHSGVWTFAPAHIGSGCVMTATHTILIDPTKIHDVLGPDAVLEDARDYVRKALGSNSRATMAHAARHASAESSEQS
jgi:ribosome-associated toxin RatA of RatAB toxin-antitoxin module